MTALLPGLLLQLSLAAPAAPPILIGAEALNKKADSVVIVDARDWRQYEDGHIPEAISMPWVDLAQMPKSPLSLSPKEVSDILTTRGIPSDKPVVIYGAGPSGFGEEGRLYWSLAWLGHKNLNVLDGGIAAWKAAGFPTNTEGRPWRPMRRFKVAAESSMRIDKAALSRGLASGKLTVLDVREPDEYGGAIKFGEPRGGHIPGAINLPWKRFLDADGAMLPKEELKKVLADHKVPIDRPLVVYCTGGVRSGFAFLALKVAGAARVANYDGSFWDWASDTSLPVDKN